MEVIISRKAEVLIEEMEFYAKLAFGLEVKLAEVFDLSAMPGLLVQVLWTRILPVFLPANLNNCQVLDSLVTAGLKKPYEEVDVMRYEGSSGSPNPRLLLIENSPRPNTDTLGLVVNSLGKTGSLWLPLKGYAIAQGLHYHLTGECLDRETWTWFPGEALTDGRTAYGYWSPGHGNIRFNWHNLGYENSRAGARLAIEVPLSLHP